MTQEQLAKKIEVEKWTVKKIVSYMNSNNEKEFFKTLTVCNYCGQDHLGCICI